ncbi:MAG: DUF2905 domain-containing protein [Anaerolineales bacterium]|nr:DUF2905 domain-containing protein [Anaerolineales bacterium]
MSDLGAAGKILIVSGLALALAGALIWLLSGSGLFGRLPGDIRIERPGLTILFPLGSMCLLSIVLTVVANVILRILKK